MHYSVLRFGLNMDFKGHYYTNSIRIGDVSLKMPALEIGASSIIPNKSETNLGVIFDKCINISEHVASVCRAAFHHLKNILTQKTHVTVLHAFITYPIDQCNSLLFI